MSNKVHKLDSGNIIKAFLVPQSHYKAIMVRDDKVDTVTVMHIHTRAL